MILDCAKIHLFIVSHQVSIRKERQQGLEKYGSVSKPCTPGEHQNSW